MENQPSNPQVDEGSLKYQKEILVQYLLSKVRIQDWHGVSDAANDIREIEAKLEVLCAQKK